MTRAFNQTEKESIHIALKEAARDSILCTGMRKTSIDELVRKTGISKGSFYAFYPSKEILFFDVIRDFHEHIQNAIIDRVKQLKENFTPADISTLLFDTYKQLDDPMMLQIMANGEMEYLMKKLPQEVVAAHQKEDEKALKLLLNHLSIRDKRALKNFSAALRAIFCILLHKREIGNESFDEVLQTLLDGICTKYIQR